MIPTAARPLLALISVLVMVSACVPRRESIAPTSTAMDTLPWTSFHWVSATLGDTTIEKVAIYVPITADTLGGTYWLQLDTGADSDVWLYTAPLAQLLRRRGAVRDTTTWFEIPQGRIGAYPIRDHAVNIRLVAGDTVRTDDPHPKIGTLGLNFFRQRVLLLDFPAQRFAILDSVAALPASIEERADWVGVDYRNDKLFLPLTLGGATYDDFFYDSGASLFPLSTTREIWRQVTGRDTGTVVLTVPSFGEQVVLSGAPAEGSVRVGTATFARPMIFHLASGPERLKLENWGFRASGLVGNALFADRHLVIIDLPRRRFGIVQRQPS